MGWAGPGRAALIASVLNFSLFFSHLMMVLPGDPAKLQKAFALLNSIDTVHMQIFIALYVQIDTSSKVSYLPKDIFDSERA
jgi:hypothetical protein